MVIATALVYKEKILMPFPILTRVVLLIYSLETTLN